MTKLYSILGGLLVLSPALFAETNIRNLSASPSDMITSDLMPDIVESSDLTIRMGQGFNSLGGLAASQDLSYCVTQSPLTSFGDSSGESLAIYVDSIDSAESFTTNLVTAGKLETGFSPLGDAGQKINLIAASASAQAKESILRKYDDKYTYVYVQIRKIFESQVLDRFEIPSANAVYFSARPAELFGKCGDRFVSGLKKGAEVIGVLRCEVTSTEEKKSLDMMVKSSGGYKGFMAQGEVSALLENVKTATDNRCEMVVTAQGGGRGTYDIKDSKGFVTSAITYVASSALDTAKPLEFFTTSYRAVVDLNFSSNVLDKIDLTLETQRAFIRKKRVDIDFYLTAIDTLAKSDPKNIAAFDKAESIVDGLNRSIDLCVHDVYSKTACSEAQSGPALAPGVRLQPIKK